MSLVRFIVSNPVLVSRTRNGPAGAPGSLLRVLLPGLLLLSMLLPLSTASGQLDTSLGGQSFDLPSGRYYEVTRIDPRLCPSPFCGGVFVRLVGRRLLHCADGSIAKECYAGFVDWSALGLTPQEEAELSQDFGAMRALVRGELVESDFGVGTPFPLLVAKDAWRGVTGTKAGRGGYWGVVPSGIACITFPCPVLNEIRLNRRWVRPLHSIDLESRSDATPDQVAEGLDALYGGGGLLVFGKHRRIFGPAGSGRELVASEFYTKVVAGSGPRACGGFTYPPNPPCDKGEFCETPPGTCYIADLPGTCSEIPEVCPLFLDPVCGCDGVTYGNDCERRQAAVALDRVGACDTPGSCGFTTCAPGLECCNPLHGICVPPGGFCIQ